MLEYRTCWTTYSTTKVPKFYDSFPSQKTKPTKQNVTNKQKATNSTQGKKKKGTPGDDYIEPECESAMHYIIPGDFKKANKETKSCR